MRIRDLSPAEFRQRLTGDGIRLAAGPFHCRLQSGIPDIANELARLYAHHTLVDSQDFTDFHVAVQPGRGLRRWLAPQARFVVDAVEPFTPLPRNQALPMLEWGLNWCITAYSHHILVIHAASVARDGRAAILPAPPGSGKSTLTAALAQRGWRLLSDELALLDSREGLIYGLARPVNLKNQAIAVMRAFAPDAVMTEPVPDTLKGTLSLMKAPGDAIARVREGARAAWVVVPSYEPGAEARLEPLPKAQAHLLLADQAFNYDIHGAAGFEATADLVDQSACWAFTYSSLDDAMRVFDELAAAP